MKSVEVLIGELKRYTVAIMDSQRNVIGTGIIVTDALVVTCYHLIEGKADKAHKNVDIFFPEFNITRSSEVLEECSDASLDIAFLKLNEGLSKVATVAPLTDKIIFGHDFLNLSFRKHPMMKIVSLLSVGKIRNTVEVINKNKKENEKYRRKLIQLYSDEIEEGASGSPILDLQTNKVIGILAMSLNYRNLFAIPIESIVHVYPELKQKNPGLELIFDFLKKIGQEGVRKYERIDELYVPPVEYDEIKEALEERRVVLITGPKEYGKTYTAVHLLWEYYNRGYKPVWFKGSDKEERIDVRKKFADVENYLKSHNIIYFEDPFGKTEYEGNVDEGITRNIVSIIETVRNTEDTYVIITSREEVFKEFEHKIISEVDLRKYEKKLNIKTPSYDYGRRKEMLLRWANVMDCEWLKNNDARNKVLEIIKDESKLPTPLNIMDFAIVTRRITNQEQLLDKIKKKSTETSRSFAEEIKDMTLDKILFLLFPFISDQFTVNFVKHKYQELINVIGIQDTAWEFNRILDWFKADKIDISNELIRFSHPSYFEAINYAISDDRFTNVIRETLTEVLLNLYHGRKTSMIAAKAIVSNYDKLPDDVRNMVFFNRDIIHELADNKENSIMLSKAIISNYDKLPEDVQNILFKLADNKGASLTVANALASNFDKLPPNIRNMLLIKLADYDETYLTVARTIVSNYDKLPEDVQNILFKLADNKGASLTVANALASNFDKLPPNIRNMLLIKLADYKGAIPSLARTIVSNYDKLPEDVQNILFKLKEDKENSIMLSKAIISNYDKLPEDVQNILFKLKEDKDISGYILSTLVFENAKNPKETMNKLFEGRT